MSNDKKIGTEDLFKDYVPEILEYDAKVDANYNTQTSNSSKKRKSSSSNIVIKDNTPTYTEEFLKNYAPEILEYDEEIDGSDEYKIRENHLSTKESLLEKIRKAKASRKANTPTFRQNIRTENEK